MSDLLNKASLVMVPSGYKEDTVFSVVPSDGSGDLSFTRASNGTRVNSAGLVEVAPWNFCDYSEDQTQWTSQNETTVTANSTTAPNGTTTADTVTPSTANDDHYRGIVLGQQVGALTAFIYVKPNGYNFFDWGIWNGSQYIVRATFDLVNLTYTFTNAGTATIESVGNGWLKCGISGTNASLTTMSLYYRSRPTGGTGAFTGNGTSGAFIWGAQLNIGSTAKPYFPTTDRLNVPRLTYQNGGGGCPSLLLEKQSTNLVTYSEQFDNAGWSKYQGGTITANSVTSPDGTQNADTLNVASGQTYSGIYQSVSGSSDVYTISIFAKYNTKRWMFIFDASASGQGWFDLQNGVLGTIPSGHTGTIENFGNGWYRCTFKKNTAVTPAFFQIGLVDGDGESTPSSNGSSYIWGAQFEASSYATSYISTTSSSATRVADYVSRSGLALTNSTFAVNFKPLDYVVELFDFEKTGGGRMFYIAVQSNGYITFNSVSGGTIGAIGSIIPKNQTCKLAFSLNASTSNVKVYINGSIIGTYATNITTFGAFFGLQSFGYNPGTQIEQISIFPSVLTDAECISLTS